MSKLLTILAAILAIGGGLFGTLFWVGFMMACMPNSKPEQLAFLRKLLFTALAAGLCLTVLAGWLVFHNRPWWGAAAGATPIVGLIVLMICAEIAR